MGLVRVLVVVASDGPRHGVCRELASAGFAPLEARCLDGALSILECEGTIAAVVCDAELGGGKDARELFEDVGERSPWRLRVALGAGPRLGELADMIVPRPLRRGAVAASLEDALFPGRLRRRG